MQWKSSKQTDTTSSTMYAEFVACYEAIGQVNCLKKFMPGLKVVDDIHRPLKLYCDNEPTVTYAHNNRSSNAADHAISLEHVSTKNMLVDQLAKGLPPNMFREHLAGVDTKM